MTAVDRIENELGELDDVGLADVLVVVVNEIGIRGRTAGEAAVRALKTATDVNIEEGIAQLEPIFES